MLMATSISIITPRSWSTSICIACFSGYSERSSLRHPMRPSSNLSPQPANRRCKGHADYDDLMPEHVHLLLSEPKLQSLAPSRRPEHPQFADPKTLWHT